MNSNQSSANFCRDGEIVIPRTMQSVYFHRTGPADVLECEETAVPAPGEGEVLVQVVAAGVNFADVVRRRGGHYPAPTPLPFNPGAEIAGIVVACGEGVSESLRGRRVIAAIITGGGYAQFALANAERLLPWPEDLSAAQAVASLVQGITAGLVLREAGQLRAGQSVFVQGAAGGVGSIAVQLAKAFGAKYVVGGVGNHSKQQGVLTMGADHVVDYSENGWVERARAARGGDIDLVLDATSGELLKQSFGLLAPYGRAVVYGEAASTPDAIDARSVISKNQTVAGFFLGRYFVDRPQVAVDMLHELAKLVRTGALKLHIHATLPLSKAADAHRMMESREHHGKIVLAPWC
ncbi:NADPH2:quinone reductase [Bradyrhizobium sp. USDA 3397]